MPIALTLTPRFFLRFISVAGADVPRVSNPGLSAWQWGGVG